MSSKPSIPKGTRDFSPTEMVRRNYIFETIKKVYRRYGFQQIETPAMENLSTLIGTGGEESDTLIFKILDSGDYTRKIDWNLFINKANELGYGKPIGNTIDIIPTEISNKIIEELGTFEFTKKISSKALRYDLTVPFARYVVQNQNDITFPFRRFQIQPVWRADRPQKGRYREFYQCDADIIGSDSLLNEVDLIKIIDDVFSELFRGKLNYTVSINNRKILQGIVESVGEQDKFEQIVVAIDKYDKIGFDAVNKELGNIGLSDKSVNAISRLTYANDMMKMFEKGVPDSLFLSKNELKELEFNIKELQLNYDDDSLIKKGIDELEFIFEKLEIIGINPGSIKFDPTLARGLGYYTGTIIEVKVDNFPSICGGGRYDDLTGKFGLKGVSGVGISFGADRIYDVLLDNDLYPEFKEDSTQVLFINFGEKEEEYCLPLLFQLRGAGINAEIYPEAVKMKKQMNFANNKGIKYVVLVGSDEMKSGKLTVKNMESGNQESLTINELINLVKS